MMTRNSHARAPLALVVALALPACSSDAKPVTEPAAGGTPSSNSVAGSPGTGGTANGSAGTFPADGGGANAAGATGNAAGASGASSPPGQVPIVAGVGVDVPYEFGTNPFGIQGGAFFARSVMGTSSVVIDKTQIGKICLKGTVDIVPTPPDGSHPPYSQYWGIDLGFNLNQSATADPTMKTPWLVPAGVKGFWFTVEGAIIPPIRFKTTPTGKDPALEQDSCAVVTPSSGVPTQVLFEDMYVQCWNGPPGSGPTDVSKGLVDVGLQVAAAIESPFPLDFCLTGFGVISG
jgi:hypothetical protein